MQIPITEINVKKRVRKEFKDIEALADSMKRLGLLNPIIVDENNVLIAGQRRLEAAKILGWDTIAANVISVDNSAFALELEIEENVQRQAFNDEELLDAFNRLNRLKNPSVFMRIWNAIIGFFKNIFKKR